MTPTQAYLLSYQYESLVVMSIKLGIKYRDLRSLVQRGKCEYRLQGKAEPIKLWDHVGAEPIKGNSP
jgi:hypothetical protein